MSGKILMVVRVLLALVFVAAGLAKLLGAPPMVQEFGLFAAYGVGQWFRFVTALVEIAGAALLIRASTAFYGAVLLLCVCVGALVAQAVVIHQDVVHVIVIGGLLAWVAVAYRRAASTAAR